MKKTVLIGIILFAICCIANHYEHNYTRKDCQVVAVNGDTVSIKDGCGFIWEYNSNDLYMDDIVDLRMNDSCSTGYVFDDTITKVIKRAK